MKDILLFWIIFFKLIIKTFSIIPEWNFENTAINLLASVNTITNETYHKVKDNMEVFIYKKFSKENGEIIYKKYVKVKEYHTGTVIYDGEVDFDEIQSFYYISNDRIICPEGKFHPHYFYDNTYSTLNLDMIQTIGDWELKCFALSDYFFVFYMMNGEYNFFYKNLNNGEWKKFQSNNEFYEVILTTELTSDDSKNQMAYIMNDGGYIKWKGNKLSVESSEIKGNDIGAVQFNKAYTYTRACLENDYHHFYYFTYSNTADFISGYYDSSDRIEYLNVESYSNSINQHSDSPFEFVDNVEIKELKFIYNYKYAYYIIYNPTKGKKYYGIIDLKKNQVVFNTEKEIITFIPYSTISMLAITSTSAYEICVIKQDGKCIDSYGCTGNEYKYILDTNGNKCGTSVVCDNFFMMHENMCADECDESIYVLNDKQCGLCSDFDSNKPYKIINTSQCLSEAEIPEEAELYNIKLHLLKCKSGYKLENQECVVDCGDKCESPTTIITPPTTIIIPPTTIIIPPTTIITPPTTIITPPTTIITPPTTIITPPTTIITPPTTIFTSPTTIITPPTTIINPPTTVIIPPTTIITPPTTVIIPPTTIISPPTTMIQPPKTEIIPPTTIIIPPTTMIITPTTAIPPTTVIIPPTTMVQSPTTFIISSTVPTTVPSTKPEVKCLQEKCLECNEESNDFNLCLSCNEELGYKKVNYTIVLTEFVDCVKKEDPLLKNFYFNETSNEYRPCYKTCKKCLIGGDAESQNCLECETNYMFRPGNNPHNNCVAYSEYYYINSYGQYKSLKTLNCPEEAKYVIKEKKSCIDDCKKDNDYKYLYNGQCLKECPSDTTNNSFICTESHNKAYLGTNELILDEKEKLNVDNLVKTYISEFSYTNNHASLYNSDDYNILVYRNPNIINDLSLKMSKINFQDCYQKVKDTYNIEEELVITVVDKVNTNNPTSYYSFFHPKSGAKLDAETICKDEVIVVKENLTTILNENDTKYELQSSLTDQGINIFDVNDPFYTDLCFDYKNPKKRDIPLSDRIKNVFPNVSLCNDGCEIDGINLEDMTASCNCKFNDITNNEVIKDNAVLDTMVGEIFDLINSSNILVVKCYKYIFKYFKNSVGGILTASIIALNLILTNIFFAKHFPKISAYIKTVTYRYLSYLSMPFRRGPPKRVSKFENKKQKTQKPVKRKRTLKQEKNNDDEDSYDKKNIIATNEKEEITNDVPKGKNKKKSKTHRVNNKKFNNNIYNNEFTSDYFDENEIIRQFVEEYLETSPDEMEYDDAIKKDDRTFCEYFKDNLKEKQIIANTFIAVDPIKSRSMKIILFNLNLILYFVINGLFISEDYISDLYNLDEEDENFFSFLPRSVARLIYTTLVSLIIGYITGFFFLEESKVKGIFKRDMDNRVILKEDINNLIDTLKTRYISFIIVVFVILLLSGYYLLCFNYVYPKTQMEWIKSSIAIIIVIQILSVLQILLEAILRFLSFACESEKLFKFGKLFS